MSLPLMAMEADSIRVWRHFMKLFAAALVAILAVVYALILLIDPYDSGQLTGYAVFGVVDESPRTANVSRGRDTQFNSAVIGNSRGQLLDPKRLSHNTGLRFVQLTVPGTGPREQLTLLRWFIRHHRQIGAILLIADPVWCSQDPEPSLMNPFPFWLYTEDTSEYLINVFHTQSLERAWRRTLLWLGLRTRSRPDGYWDYEIGRTWAFRPDIPVNFIPAAMRARVPELPFPAVERLRTALTDLDADVPLAIAMAPSFFTELPGAGDPNADRIPQCKGALAKVIGERRHGVFLDFEVDGNIARNPENFMDGTHYRGSVARLMEAHIESSLRQ
jgi:hypothetical protein